MADRLISADDLVERAYRLRLDDRERIAQMIESAPTVDAVEVVWCKDCQFWHTEHCPLEYADCVVDAHDFCAWGGRREDGKAD